MGSARRLVRAGVTGGSVGGADSRTSMATGDTTADAATVSTSDAAARDTTAEAATRDTTADASARDATAEATAADRAAADSTTDTTEAAADTTANSTTSDRATFLLGLVLDEVNFGFGGLGGSSSGDGDVGLFVGFLDQHVDKGLLFVLGLSGDDGCDRCGRSWGLNEDDFVVLLGDGTTADYLWALFFRFWGGNVDVDVLLDDGSASEAAAESTADSTTRESTTDSTTR